MTFIALGLIVWIVPHMFKRLAPDMAAGIPEGPRKVAVALLSVLAIVLMVIGYRGATGTVYWGRSAPLVGINNLLMLAAFYVYAVGGPKGPRIWLGTKLRHPQLTGFSLWAIAHLLVNGDTPSFLLFGGLLIWAQAEILIINMRDGPWTPPPRAAKSKEIIYIVATIVLVVVVMLIHNWLGVQPWG